VEGYDIQLAPPTKAMLADVLASSAIGSPDTVRRGLSSFIDRTHPDELMLTSQIFDHAARLRSYEIAADLLTNS
jgi:alkanesulfonate monooxygenase SsuD/methylene tetrahydromethanopterin reductase-like flavin-dependent oxidoreductase (luciferase family)